MVDDSREQSPDWLRSFQAPSQSFLSISSSSDPSPSNSQSWDELESGKGIVAEKHKIEYTVLENSGDEKPAGKTKNTRTLKSEKQEEDQGSFDSVDDKPIDKTKKSKKFKEMEEQDLIEGAEDAHEGEIAETDGSKKPILSNDSSRLPLVLPEKVQRSKVLIECEGDAIDLSGDVGAVGRVIISKTASENDEMLLDLKGTIYKSMIVPSATFCIVSFGQTEAKIESIMTDFVQLKPQSNVFEAETMIEGTLDGFSFDSEGNGDYLQKPIAHQNDQETEKAGQAKGMRSEKVEKGVPKKAKSTGKPSAKPVKRAARKPQTTKKGKIEGTLKLQDYTDSLMFRENYKIMSLLEHFENGF